MADRRPLRFWQPFNDWWRGELEKLGRRPNAQEIVTWYHMHAYELWQGDAPSIQETRVHAKCLRSLPLVRDYFRSYRAKKRHSGSGHDDDDGREDDTAEGEDRTPVAESRPVEEAPTKRTRVSAASTQPQQPPAGQQGMPGGVPTIPAPPGLSAAAGPTSLPLGSGPTGFPNGLGLSSFPALPGANGFPTGHAPAATNPNGFPTAPIPHPPAGSMPSMNMGGSMAMQAGAATQANGGNHLLTNGSNHHNHHPTNGYSQQQLASEISLPQQQDLARNYAMVQSQQTAAYQQQRALKTLSEQFAATLPQQPPQQQQQQPQQQQQLGKTDMLQLPMPQNQHSPGYQQNAAHQQQMALDALSEIAANHAQAAAAPQQPQQQLGTADMLDRLMMQSQQNAAYQQQMALNALSEVAANSRPQQQQHQRSQPADMLPLPQLQPQQNGSYQQHQQQMALNSMNPLTDQFGSSRPQQQQSQQQQQLGQPDLLPMPMLMQYGHKPSDPGSMQGDNNGILHHNHNTWPSPEAGMMPLVWPAMDGNRSQSFIFPDGRPPQSWPGVDSLLGPQSNNNTPLMSASQLGLSSGQLGALHHQDQQGGRNARTSDPLAGDALVQPDLSTNFHNHHNHHNHRNHDLPDLAANQLALALAIRPLQERPSTPNPGAGLLWPLNTQLPLGLNLPKSDGGSGLLGDGGLGSPSLSGAAAEVERVQLEALSRNELMDLVMKLSERKSQDGTTSDPPLSPTAFHSLSGAPPGIKQTMPGSNITNPVYSTPETSVLPSLAQLQQQIPV